MTDFNEYDINDLPELSAEEKARPYANYYYRKISKPPIEILENFEPGKQMDPIDAILPEKLNMLLDPECPEPKMGYCLLPNGGSYSCTISKMPHVTKEMMDFYGHFALGEHLKFKILYPGFHFEHYDGLAMENFGEGNKALLLDKMYSAEDLGLVGEPTKVNPGIIDFVAKKTQFVSVSGPIDLQRGKFTLVFLKKKLDQGVAIWTIVYFGIHIENGKSVVKLGPGEVTTAERCRRNAIHLAYEFANQESILPELYEEYGKEAIVRPQPWPERYRYLIGRTED